MPKLLTIGLVGLFAQLIDGALGMSYGVTSTSLLLTVGVAPAVASASVHLAEIGTTLASGAAHWKLGNTDWKIVSMLALPGFIGAFAGAVLLSSLSAESAAPIVSGILLLLGVYVLWRFLRSDDGAPKPNRIKRAFMVPLGLVAGAMDALGGGGWGPIGTPTLLATSDIEPRKVVGSIDTSEFVVAVGASIGFLVGLGSESIDYSWVGALMAGGLIAAPIAAWIVKSLSPKMLGLSVGTLIIFTNLQTIGDAAGLDPDLQSGALLAFGLVWVATVGTLLIRRRRGGLDGAPA